MVKLERDLKVPLEFEGWEIGYVSTHLPGKERWTELRVWAVDPRETDVRWVVESVGRSTVPGEKDRRDAIPCSTPSQVVDALSKKGQLTAPGRTVLDMAVSEDDELVFVLSDGVDAEVERL